MRSAAARTALLLTLAALLVAGHAAAAGPAPAQSKPGVLDAVAKGLGQAGSAVAGAAGAVGHGVSSAASGVGHAIGAAVGAIGHALAAAAQALGRGLAALGSALVQLGRAATSGLAWLGRALVDAVTAAARLAGTAAGWAASALGLAARGLATGIAAVATSTGAGLGRLTAVLAQLGVAAGRLLGTAASAAAGAAATALAALTTIVLRFITALRPAKLDPVVYNLGVAAAATGTTALAGYGVWSALRRWGWVSMAGFSRIAEDDLLQHPVRRTLFETVQANPGIHASELARRSGTGWGTVMHHMDKLERGRLLVTRKVNNQKCYFENGGKVSRADMAVAGAVRKDKAALISAFVESHPMSSQKQVAQALGMSAALTSFHVRKLSNLGVLDVVRRGKETLLATSQAMRRITQPEAPVPVPVSVMQVA